MRKNPYKIIFNRHMTEKSKVLENLQNSESNKSVRKCKSPKYVFIVDDKVNKSEIENAIESIYSVGVVKVNTIQVKPKKKRTKGRLGKSNKFKKAIVTLREGDVIEEQV